MENRFQQMGCVRYRVVPWTVTGGLLQTDPYLTRGDGFNPSTGYTTNTIQLMKLLDMLKPFGVFEHLNNDASRQRVSTN